MWDFIVRLRNSKTFHLCLVVIAAAALEYFRGTVTLHAAGLVVAASLAAIFLRDAIKKGFEAVAAKLGVSPEAITRLENLVEQEIAAQVVAHEGALVSHITARGIDAATAERVAKAFVATVTETLPKAPDLAAAVAQPEK